MSTPIERLRNEHRHCSCWGENCAVKRHPNEDWDSHCEQCSVTWPCDTIAALDALEADLKETRDIATSHYIQLRNLGVKNADMGNETADALQARLHAATVLIRQAMKEVHLDHYRIDSRGQGFKRIDTCENCRPYREWLEGEGQ